MIRRRPRTLLWQLGLTLMLMQAAVAVFLTVYSFVELRRSLHDQVLQELRRLAPVTALQLRDMLTAHDEVALQDAVALIAGAAQVRLTVIDALDGRVLAESDLDPATMDSHQYREEVNEALRNGSGHSSRRSATLDLDMMYFALRMEQDGLPTAVIRVARPLAAVNAELWQLVRVIGTVGVLLLLLTFVVIYTRARRLSGVVVSLGSAARRFAAGDLDHRLAPLRTRELSILARSLNAMAARLSATIHELRVQRNEQQAILQSMSSGMIALDTEHRVFSMNQPAETMLGVSADDARGRLMEEVIRGVELLQFVKIVYERQERTTRELRSSGAEGRNILAVGEPLKGPSGEPRGLLIVLNDVTQLRQLESIRSDFAANVSHELRTPITNIKGYVLTMLDVGIDDAEQTRRFLQIINRNANRLESIIEDLLALARLEQPGTKEQLLRADAPVSRFASAAAAHFSSAAEAKGITISVDVPDDLVAPVYEQLMEQALANLVSNAVKYSPSHTTVTVRARMRDDDLIEIAVSDQGPGIEARHLPRLFERFYRVDRARSRELGGTGLGLAIVKYIALVHDGRSEVESEVGSGSVFRLVFPGRATGTTDDSSATGADLDISSN